MDNDAVTMPIISKPQLVPREGLLLTWAQRPSTMMPKTKDDTGKFYVLEKVEI